MTYPTTDGNRRILIVDDNEAIHEDFRKVLGTANNSVQALAASQAACSATRRPSIRVMNWIRLIRANKH